ncbi:hypothetical protein MOF52_15330 [Bacillus inaquosorum]|uniref:hypothetical protein n=1 Tax=Bacillus inaquosorum TaxID=483913 RepID=UPI00227F6884|nr:hypothetical protein [Bacillus inaquosorum]MCY8054529.1 hypothetical protein [Bacillus inaquosorum]MCY9409377.1 hypothetical protein [Bacillus inaquosorum]MCY9418577.1 hypothetical protein [Bacillus inaquosorum]
MATVLDANIGQVITVYELEGFYQSGVLKEIDTTLNLIKLEHKIEETGKTYIRYFPLATILYIQEGEPSLARNCGE